MRQQVTALDESLSENVAKLAANEGRREDLCGGEERVCKVLAFTWKAGEEFGCAEMFVETGQGGNGEMALREFYGLASDFGTVDIVRPGQVCGSDRSTFFLPDVSSPMRSVRGRQPATFCDVIAGLFTGSDGSDQCLEILYVGEARADEARETLNQHIIATVPSATPEMQEPGEVCGPWFNEQDDFPVRRGYVMRSFKRTDPIWNVHPHDPHRRRAAVTIS